MTRQEGRDGRRRLSGARTPGEEDDAPPDADGAGVHEQPVGPAESPVQHPAQGRRPLVPRDRVGTGQEVPGDGVPLVEDRDRLERSVSRMNAAVEQRGDPGVRVDACLATDGSVAPSQRKRRREHSGARAVPDLDGQHRTLCTPVPGPQVSECRQHTGQQRRPSEPKSDDSAAQTQIVNLGAGAPNGAITR